MHSSHWKIVNRFLVMALLSLAALSCVHPKQTVTNLPAGVSQQEVLNWYAATGALRRTAQLGLAAQWTVIQLHQGGLFKDEQSYRVIQTAFLKVGQTGQEAADFLDKQPNVFGKTQSEKMIAVAQDLAAALQDATASGLIGIKNPDSQALVKQDLDQILASLAVLNAVSTSP